MKKLSLFFALLFLFLSLTPVKAENMTSDSYYLQFGNFNMGSGEFDRTGQFGLTYTLGGTAVGPFGEYGTSQYFIGSGFQYIYQIRQFSFSISKLAIEFGDLTAGIFANDSHTITINTGSAGGYQIYVFEDRPLSLANNLSIRIPNTTCNTTCTKSLAGIWDNPNRDGFGYNVFGNNVANDFINSTYFRPFADNSVGEDMELIMSSPNVAFDETATVTYQVVPSAAQTAGDYQTYVMFVAVPGY
ncbi:MAG: hypothetical protein GX559_03380 [Candidatus Pacebacteria bacterium]|nr:hypothetical protein [Candidatus Paceibacterota bacterium]